MAKKTPSSAPQAGEMLLNNEIVSDVVTFTGSTRVNLNKYRQRKGGSFKNALKYVVMSLKPEKDASPTYATLDLGTKTTHVNTVIQARVPGAGGNSITVAFVADAGTQAGSVTDVGGVVTVHYDPSVSTVADIEKLLATSVSVKVKTAGTQSNVLVAVSDAFTATALAGGGDEEMHLRPSAKDNGDGTFTLYAYVANFGGSNWIAATTPFAVRWTALLEN